MLPRSSVESQSVNLGPLTEGRSPALLKIQSNELPCALATSCSRLSMDWKLRLSRMKSCSNRFEGTWPARPCLFCGLLLGSAGVLSSTTGASEIVADSWDARSLLWVSFSLTLLCPTQRRIYRVLWLTAAPLVGDSANAFVWRTIVCARIRYPAQKKHYVNPHSGHQSRKGTLSSSPSAVSVE